MNLFFRLIWVMLRAWNGTRHAPLTDPRQTQFTVWLTDQDMFMHMTNSRYLSFADLGRVDLFIRTGLRRAMNEHRWRAEIAGQTMTINRMLKAPKSFQVETHIQGWDQDYIALAQTFLRNGKTHASVNTVLRIQDKSGQRIAPEHLMQLIAPAVESPSIPKLLADLIEKTEAAASASQAD